MFDWTHPTWRNYGPKLVTLIPSLPKVSASRHRVVKVSFTRARKVTPGRKVQFIVVAPARGHALELNSNGLTHTAQIQLGFDYTIRPSSGSSCTGGDGTSVSLVDGIARTEVGSGFVGFCTSKRTSQYVPRGVCAELQ